MECKPLRIALITSLRNQFIINLILSLKGLSGTDFEYVIIWRQTDSLLRRLGQNLKKHGILYVPWRLIRFGSDLFLNRIRGMLEEALLWPKMEMSLSSVCLSCGIKVYEIHDIHSSQSIDLLKSLNCDIFAVCGTRVLRKSVFDIPKIGTINLHQGKTPEYRGAPPGFWELWNGEKQAGVTIHFVDAGIDTGDIILQEMVPVFEYDNLHSIQEKLNEISLGLYPRAIQMIAAGEYQRVKQAHEAGKQYYFPTLRERSKLFLKIKWKHFDRKQFAKSIVKKIIFPPVLWLIWMKDYYLIRRRKNILIVLYYHRVTNICKDGMTIGIEAFEKQIRFLKKYYHILSVQDFNKWLDGGNTNGKSKWEKGVLVTFDDGYEDNYINALPVLSRYSVPAIYFVSTGLIGNERQFAHDCELYPELAFRKMSWAQLKSAKQLNVEIGIHTHSHANLGFGSTEAAMEEIETSIKEYRCNMGRMPTLMSYPFGGKKDISKEVIDYIKNQPVIQALFSAYGGRNISPIERYDVKRINIGSKDVGLSFLFKVEGGFQSLISGCERKAGGKA